MNIVPPAVEALIQELGKLPSIGRRTAERLAFHLMQAEEERAALLAEAVLRVKREIGSCPHCHFLTQGDTCAICNAPNRDTRVLCVVERSLDVISFEKAGGYRGLYHVLGGHLSPLRGITAEDLHIADLLERIEREAFEEVVLATNPSVEGDATALYLAQCLGGGAQALDESEEAAEEAKPAPPRLTRLGRGLPTGATLEYTDPNTLRTALEGRRRMT